MFDGHYDEWIQSRLTGLKKYIPDQYFQGKTLLELGCGFAHIGNEFSKMGAIVTSLDARSEHIEQVHKLYPHLNANVFDAEKGTLDSSYDIILHWGLLYHLSEIEEHIAKLSTKCNVLLLETEVAFSESDSYFISINEIGYDQAFNEKGIRPSASYVEKVLQANGFQSKMILDPSLNSKYHFYDWPLKVTNGHANGYRRFWICWRDGMCPL